MPVLTAPARTRRSARSASAATPPAPPWSPLRWTASILRLTAASFLIAGWHPFAEDGGMYLTRVSLRLDPTLYPHDHAFLVEPLPLSLFEPAVAGLVHLGPSLASATLALHLMLLAMTLTAGLVLLRRITADEFARLTGIALLAACASLPVAATSLLLVDPYLTARSFAAPCTLFAMAFALDTWQAIPVRIPHAKSLRHPGALCALSLIAAIAFHPLMGCYAAALVVMLRLARGPNALPRMLLAAAASLALAAAATGLAAPEGPAARAADLSRYYWFLSQWRWYELAGILLPAAILALFARRPKPDSPQFQHALPTLARGTLALLATGFLLALCFARQSMASHAIARLQPLRVLWIVYALLPLLLGAALGSHKASQVGRTLDSRRESHSSRGAAPPRGIARHAAARSLPAAVIACTAVIFFAVQRESFPASPHIEWPSHENPNPWVRAFVWSRDHTNPAALFALDARYVNLDGEDAQNFRALSQRSSLPDYSKDGGAAANRPALAPLWRAAANAQQQLSDQTPAQRNAALAPFHPDWLLLSSRATVETPCPYDNGTVKICPFAPAARSTTPRGATR